MNLRALKYLVAVADHQHFGKAAEACFISQPALSMQLKKLEETLGVQLFERTNKKVMITDVGSNIAERTRIILQEVDEITEVAKSYNEPFSGELKLGAFPTLAPYLLPKIVPSLTKQYPNLKLLLVEEKTDNLITDLQNGKLDATLLALPIDDNSLEHTVLFEDEFLLATAKSHPLAKHKSITKNDLQNESLLLLEDGHCLRNQALDVCSIIGSPTRQDFRATSLETLRQMVAANVGITLIPNIAQKDNDNIAYIPFKSPAPSRSICMAWRKTSARKDYFKEIAENIKEMI